MSAIAIITARGGSKRIPRKNIKDFLGKPILAYSIEAARKSQLFAEVMVSTEDEEIASIARSYGANVPFLRSQQNADDYSGTADVLEEVVETYEKNGQSFKWLCCLYPTAPFVTAEALKKAYQKLKQEKAEALLPVVKYAYPPQRCFVIETGKLRYKWPQYIRSRSQDLEPYYHDAGQFYWLKTKIFKAQKTLVPENTIPFLLSELDVQDIDQAEDWEIAEMKYRWREEQQKDGL